MKRSLVLSCGAVMSVLSFYACSSSDDSMVTPLTRSDAVSEKIVFQDDFNQTDSIPDKTKWGLCKKGSPAWSKYLSESYDQAYVHDGKLVLIAEKVNGVYKTGGVQSLGKAEFQYGKIEICARFTKTAKGGWPAIWMMPAKPVYSGWPACGEIDIMEQLNHDGIKQFTATTKMTWDSLSLFQQKQFLTIKGNSMYLVSNGLPSLLLLK